MTFYCAKHSEHMPANRSREVFAAGALFLDRQAGVEIVEPRWTI